MIATQLRSALQNQGFQRLVQTGARRFTHEANPKFKIPYIEKPMGREEYKSLIQSLKSRVSVLENEVKDLKQVQKNQITNADQVWMVAIACLLGGASGTFAYIHRNYISSSTSSILN